MYAQQWILEGIEEWVVDVKERGQDLEEGEGGRIDGSVAIDHGVNDDDDGKDAVIVEGQG